MDMPIESPIRHLPSHCLPSHCLPIRRVRSKRSDHPSDRARHTLPWLLPCLLFLAGCRTTTIEQHEWRQIDTPHFTLISNARGTESAQLARELERFRALVLRVSGTPLAPEPVPTRIFLFADWGSYFAYTAGTNMLGFNYPTLRANYLVISPGVYHTDPKRIIFHEYVHYLLRHQRTRYPTWFDEGLAEFLSDVREVGDELRVGNIPREGINAHAIQWRIPLRELMATDFVLDWRPARIAAFYGQSWATVSYLLSQPVSTDAIDRRPQLATYLRLLNAGEPRATAFEAAFGTNEAELTREVRRHLQRRRLPGIGVPIAELPPLADVRHRVLASHAVAAELGELTLLQGQQRAPLAEQLFNRALAVQPADGAARAGLALALAQQQRYEEALAQAKRAVANTPTLARVHIDLAKILFGLCGDAARATHPDCRRMLEVARTHFEQSVALAPHAPEAHAGMGMTLAQLQEDHAGAIEHLSYAYDLSQWLPQIGMAIAKLYLAEGRQAEARTSLTHVVRWAKSEQLRREAESLLASLQADVQLPATPLRRDLPGVVEPPTGGATGASRPGS